MSSLPVYVGLDYHSESIRVCVLREDGTMLLNKSVPNCAAIVNDCVDHFGIPSVVGIEACCGAADFATELRDMTGWNVQLAHAGYVAKLKRGRDKTAATPTPLSGVFVSRKEEGQAAYTCFAA